MSMTTTRLYPRVHVDTAEVGAVGQAGGVLLTATHDPGKVCRAAARGAGGYGPVASDATVSRTITALAKDSTRVLAAVNTARAGPAPGRGRWPVTAPRTGAPMPRGRWSST